MARRIWIYHKSEKPQAIFAAKFSSFEKDGWSKSPLPFLKIADHGIAEEDTAGVQFFGEMIMGVVHSINGALNIPLMTKKELKKYAREHFDKELHLVDFPGKKGLRNMRDMIVTIGDINTSRACA